jgi:hypothetical protein
MDWNDPAARAALAEQVGPAEYNKRLAEHREASVICEVAGHKIRPAHSFRFGSLFLVGDTGVAFSTFAEAKQHAEENPVREAKS